MACELPWLCGRLDFELLLYAYALLPVCYWRAQDHNYTAPLPCTPPPSPTKLGGLTTGALPLLAGDDPGGATPVVSASAGGIREVVVTTTGHDEDDPAGAAAAAAVGDDSVTRCICDFQHDDGYMICCDQCGYVRRARLVPGWG